MTAVGPDISLVAPWPGPPLTHLLRPCDRPLVFAGAGVSAGCGLPTGAQLAAWLRAQKFAAGADFSGLDDRGRGDHPGYVASRIRDADPGAYPAVREAVAAHVSSVQARATYSRVVQAIARTRTGVVLTLNYDTLVEEAARAARRPAESLLLADVPELVNDHMLDPDGTLRVVHLHGIVTEPESLVLDHVSYMQQANDGRVQELFAAMLVGHNLCAIGTRFEEDYLGAVMLARRPTVPRHVIVCDLELAEEVRTDAGGLGVERHNVLPCAYPVGEYEVLEPFCEQLVTCEENGPPPGGPMVRVADADADAVYAPRQLVARDEVARESALPVELQVEFGDLTAHGETSLEREQLAIVVGPPGSGKTRLLQELARRPGADRVLLLRLRDVRDAVGEPEALLRLWLEAAAALAGEPVAIESVLAGQVRIWLLLDALDEVPLERRRAVAEAIEMLSCAFPQHRFTVTSRPVAALADLSPTWRVFDLVCDRSWRSEFLAANQVEEERFWAELAPAGARLESLLRVPFFLRGAVHLLEHRQTVTDAMQIALALLDESLQADESLAPLGAAPRAWLKRVAVLQQLSGGGSIGDDALEALAADQGGLGDLAVLTDLLASRSLLAASSGRWTFTHRLFGEALAAEQLLDEPPERWLDCVAPMAGEWSAVLDQWSATLAMVLFRSAEWRRRVAPRDPRFAARATPPDAPGGGRLEAASLLWRRAAELDVWIDPVSRGPAARDAEVIAALDRGGDLDPLLRDVRDALGARSRYVRGNAVDVLAALDPPDAAGLLGDVLADDPDPVVRRAAASAARGLELSELSEAISLRALDPADDAEASTMATAAIDLTPPERRLDLARELARAGNEHGWDYGDLSALPLAEQVAWMVGQAEAESGPVPLLGPDTAKLIAEVGENPDEDVTRQLGYLAAVVRSRDPGVVEFVSTRVAAVEGVLWALREKVVVTWEIGRLLGAIPVETMRQAGGGEEVLGTLWRFRSGPSAPGELGGAAPVPREVDRGPEALESTLELEGEELRAALLMRAHLTLMPREELSPARRDALGRALNEWWDGNDLREAIHREGRSAKLESWATAVLAFGPVAELALDDERWVQAATCGWLYQPQVGWLSAQADQERLDAAASGATDVRTLADLLRIGSALDTGGVERLLTEADLTETEDVELARAGEAVVAASGREGLLRLAVADERWAAPLRPKLARAGVVEAQIAELNELVRQLRAGEDGEAFDLDWMGDVEDPRALPALEEVLVAAGSVDKFPQPRAFGLATKAIEGVGGQAAVALLDRVAREQTFPGAQFLIENRDRVVQALLWPVAQSTARVLAERLGLPLEEAADGPTEVRLLGQIGRRLRDALEDMELGGSAIALSARLEPVAVRGGAAEQAVPVQVDLGEQAEPLLGEQARGSALLADGYLRIWLAGLGAVPTAAKIHVAALRPDGEVLATSAEVTHAPMQLELPWSSPRPPGEIAVAVVIAGE